MPPLTRPVSKRTGSATGGSIRLSSAGFDEEHLMKPRESDSFRLRLHFDWFATLQREDERLCSPFKYAVKAYCLDNIQTFGRLYITLEQALLHCLNGFNENVSVPNRYRSIKEYLSKYP